MAAVPAVRALHGLHQSFVLQQSFRLVSLQLTSTCLSRRLCSAANGPKLPQNPENESLLENLNLMGVDIRTAHQRQPGVFRRLFTNEKVLAQFLKEKGASCKVIASIVSRFPRSITRSLDHLEQRWQLWRNVFSTDAEIISILERSPESFFRSSDNENLQKNIAFLMSLSLSSKVFHRLMTKAPRTFSNSVALNKQKVELLEDICLQLGGKNPQQFAKTIITKNIYVLIMSDKRIQSNVDTLKDFLKLSDSALLDLLEGRGAYILDLSSEYLKRNLKTFEQKMFLLGCDDDEIKKMITKYPEVLDFGPTTLNAKLDCLLNGGITIKQILEKPKVLDFRVQIIAERLEQLQTVGYDLKQNGIHILDSSQKRFLEKMNKLSAFNRK
ncbi:transcription termination factor 1, mitochondrial [Nematolebias whitei]|uniref:transcription termination factor 1, mitochondrial n=1 Tax=Nematolebias whitei TaxID=451745 RepID=UPI00189AC874|nr:transcription termination factor 1, mitochondrial [Nematolebias whitei]